jgi:hypothetical protein
VYNSIISIYSVFIPVLTSIPTGEFRSTCHKHYATISYFTLYFIINIYVKAQNSGLRAV